MRGGVDERMSGGVDEWRSWLGAAGLWAGDYSGGDYGVATGDAGAGPPRG